MNDETHDWRDLVTDTEPTEDTDERHAAKIAFLRLEHPREFKLRFSDDDLADLLRSYETLEFNKAAGVVQEILDKRNNTDQ